MTRAAAVIVAAGRGTRAGGDVPKQWQMLAGVPVLARTVQAFAAHDSIGQIVLVLHADDMDRAASGLSTDVTVVSGGADRAC